MQPPPPLPLPHPQHTPDREPARLSQSAVRLVTSYWRSRAPLAFVAAQPRCRIACELRCAAVPDAHEDGEEACAAAWSAWARQLPFGERWVSDLAERVMPSERLFDGEVRFMDAVDDIVDDPHARGGQHHDERHTTAAPLPRGGSRRVYPPGVGGRSLPLLLPPPQQQQQRRCSRPSSYFYYEEQRSAATAAAIAGAAALGDVVDGGSWRRQAASLPDHPFTGAGLPSTALRAGYRGGVLVGHLVSFLVPEAAWRSARYDTASSATSPAQPSARAARRAPVTPAWRRVLHWDVRAEEAHRPLAAARDVAGHRDRREAAALASAVDCAADAQHSWGRSLWWLSRALTIEPLTTRSSSSSTPSPHDSDVCDCPADTCVRAASHVAAASTSLYVYGSHPATLLRYVGTGREGLAASHRTPRPPESSNSGVCGPPKSHANVPASMPRRYAGFLSDIHLHDCRAPPLLSTWTTSSDAAQWWGDLAACDCCADLQMMDIHFDGIDEEEENGGGGGGGGVESRDAAPSPPPWPEQQHVTGAMGHRASAPLSYVTPSAFSRLRELHLTSSASLSDVEFLGELPALRLANLSFNARLTDLGLRGLCRCTSLRVVDVRHCPLVDTAAAELVRRLAKLEELYLSGTGLTDATLQSVSDHLRLYDGSDVLCAPPAAAAMASPGWIALAPAASTAHRRCRLRVLHVSGCRRLRNPHRALAAALCAPGAEERRLGVWAGVQELRVSAADVLGESRRGRVLSPSDGEDAWRREEEEEEDHGTPPSTPSSSSLIDGPVERRRRPAAPSLSDSICSRGAVWVSLTTLVVTDTVFRSPLGDVGRLPALQHLSLLRCSVEADENEGLVPRGSDGAVHDHRGGRPPPRPRRPWLSGLEQSALLHTVHLDGCDGGLVGDAASLRILARLPSLLNLSLAHTSIRDADLDAFIAAVRDTGAAAADPQHSLQRLCLRSCSRIAHANVAALLPSLRALDVSDTAVRQEVLDALVGSASLPPDSGGGRGGGGAHALQTLNCAACSLLVDMSAVARLRHLRWLDVSHTPISTAGVAELRLCPALTHLTLKNCTGVRHVRDVMAMPTLEVLNAQGSGLYDSSDDSSDEAAEEEGEEDGRRAVGWPRRTAAHRPGRHRVSLGTPPRRVRRGGGGAAHPTTGAADVFPFRDDVLRTSALHTLLLSHTRVRRIRRLGLLPALACLDLSSTAVSDSELVRFVCTGAGAGAVVHSLRSLPADLCDRHRGGGPPLRVLSLQLCRGIFSVGVLGLCPHLAKLDVSYSNVTSHGLVGLHRSPSLAQMRLVSCKGVHDLRVVWGIPTLEDVDGSGCNVHSGRVTGRGVWGDAADATAAESGVCHLLPGAGQSRSPPLRHSDMYEEDGLTNDERVLVRRVVEGPPITLLAGTLRVASRALASTRRECGCSLQRLVLDGCANISGLEELGVLPCLMELSMCNCHGITAASVAELSEFWRGAAEVPCAATPAIAASAPTQPLSAPFPALRVLRLSSCRNLRGSLAGLELLPALRRVYVDRCGVANVADVVPDLRSRVVL
ncbi:Leucine Rich repeat [Novymonas esmeraldas]|uniref:Leucine Rich repeat n=1 Tax=Novymonas esmeraldas TaxID=1808958 RepID=A0AAW0EV59_9TRYP